MSSSFEIRPTARSSAGAPVSCSVAELAVEDDGRASTAVERERQRRPRQIERRVALAPMLRARYRVGATASCRHRRCEGQPALPRVRHGRVVADCDDASPPPPPVSWRRTRRRRARSRIARSAARRRAPRGALVPFIAWPVAASRAPPPRRRARPATRSREAPASSLRSPRSCATRATRPLVSRLAGGR